MDVATVSGLAGALSDRTRLRVLELANGQSCIAEIATALNLTSATVTYHVGRLADVGLVTLVRNGRRTTPRRVPYAGLRLVRALG